MTPDKQAREALEALVYEITHLSPMEDDGSHRCKISAAALAQARSVIAALRTAEATEPVAWTDLLDQLADSSFVSESRAATLRAIADHLRYRTTPPPSPVTDERATHRHKKSGTEYVLLGIGRMQAKWREWRREEFGYSEHPVDMREVAIYRSVKDCSELWVRPREEFEDGRFEALAALEPAEEGR